MEETRVYLRVITCEVTTLAFELKSPNANQVKKSVQIIYWLSATVVSRSALNDFHLPLKRFALVKIFRNTIERTIEAADHCFPP